MNTGRSWAHRDSWERTAAACSVGILLRIAAHYHRTSDWSNWERHCPSYARERTMVAAELGTDHPCTYSDRYDLRKVVLSELDLLFQMIHLGDIHHLRLWVRQIR